MPDLFREDQPVAPLPLAFLVAMALMEALLAFGLHGLPRLVRIVEWAAAVILLLSAWVIRRLSIRVTRDLLIFAFGPFRKRIRRAEIGRVRIMEASLARTGIGVHRTAGGIWAWVARGGPAVEVLLSQGAVRGYIISTNRPLDLKAALLEGDAADSLAKK